MFRLNLKEISLLAGPAAAADSIITLDGTTVTSTVRLVGLVEALTLDNAVLLRNIDSDHAKTKRLKDTDIGKEKTDKIITLRLTSNSIRSGEKKNFSLQAKKKISHLVEDFLHINGIFICRRVWGRGGWPSWLFLSFF